VRVLAPKNPCGATNAVSPARFLFVLSVSVTLLLAGCILRTLGLFSHQAQPFFLSHAIFPLDGCRIAGRSTALWHSSLMISHYMLRMRVIFPFPFWASAFAIDNTIMNSVYMGLGLRFLCAQKSHNHIMHSKCHSENDEPSNDDQSHSLRTSFNDLVVHP